MDSKSQALEQHAKAAIQQYNDLTSGGGEPVFPDWALDLLMVLDRTDKLAAALKSWHTFAVDNKYTDRDCTFLPATRAALAAVGAFPFDRPDPAGVIARIYLPASPVDQNAARYLALRDVPDDQLGAAGVPCVAMPTGPQSGNYANGEDVDRMADEAIEARKYPNAPRIMLGHQWTAEQIAAMSKGPRPALEFNKIVAAIHREESPAIVASLEAKLAGKGGAQ